MDLISIEHITTLLAGMLIMTCTMGACTFLWSKRMSGNIQLDSHPSTPLRWWTGAVAAIAALGFTTVTLVTLPESTLDILNFHIVCIDMPILPMAAIVMVLTVAPQHITWTRILYNLIPFLILCPLCLVINQPWYTYSVVAAMVGYLIAMMVYMMIVGKRYENQLKDEYSSLKGRSTRWLISVIIFMVLILTDFALFIAYQSGWDTLYYAVHLVAWNVVLFHLWSTVLLREKNTYEIDVDELAKEEAEEKERGPLMSEDTETFTKRLTELIETEQIYSQDDLTRDDMARMMGMSHTTFSKLLKVTTGQSFYEYINGLRIDKATEMINEGKMDIWSIGQIVGYRYRSTFYRAFAAKHGCTPAEYTEKEK